MPWTVTNSTRNAVLADRAERALTLGQRLKGLLGRDGFGPGEALEIAPCNSVHTFFMRFPIDVLFLGAEGQVVRAIDMMRPWRATRIYVGAERVVELPAGAIARSGTRVGDLVVLTERAR